MRIVLRVTDTPPTSEQQALVRVVRTTFIRLGGVGVIRLVPGVVAEGPGFEVAFGVLEEDLDFLLGFGEGLFAPPGEVDALLEPLERVVEREPAFLERGDGFLEFLEVFSLRGLGAYVFILYSLLSSTIYNTKVIKLFHYFFK